MKNTIVFIGIVLLGFIASTDLANPGYDCETDTECFEQCINKYPIESRLQPDHPDYVECI